MSIWLYFILFLSMLLELSLSGTGILLPFTLMGGFYMTLVFDWRRSVFPFLLFEVIKELAFGRIYPVGIISAVAAMLFVPIWRRHGNLHESGVQALPGMILGLFDALATFIYMLNLTLAGNGGIMQISPVIFVMQIAGGCLLFPAYCAILDNCASRLQFRRYRYVRRFKAEDEDWQ